LASSSISKPQSAPRNWPDLDYLRHRGHRGGEIRMHRGMIRFAAARTDITHSLVIPVALTLLWIHYLPLVCRFWFDLFVYWSKALHLEGSITMLPQRWSKMASLSLPFVNVQAGAISPSIWVVTSFVTLGALLFTFLLSDEYTPWKYIIRALVFIQATALVYFAVASARFPHDIPTYTTGMLSFGVILIGMIPIVLAFTFYPFDFALWKKLALTALLTGHLILFFPLQYTLQAYILHGSILFMPLLYFAFGPFLDVLIFVCFYSWGMSWKSRSQASPKACRKSFSTSNP